MDKKFPQPCICVPDAKTQEWYETEHCWNCEPAELREIQSRKTRPAYKRHGK